MLQKHAYAVCWINLQEHRPDIVNDAVWRAISQGGTFEGESKFSTWFQAIVNNLCNSELRHKKLDRREVGMDEVTAELSQVETQDVLAKLELEDAIKGLGEEDRELVLMHYIGMNESEIGAKLGISHVAARQRWSRVKAKIRKEMGR